MKTFTMSAVCRPSKSDNWFPGFQEGLEFYADDLEQAHALVSAELNGAGGVNK